MGRCMDQTMVGQVLSNHLVEAFGTAPTNK